MLIDQETNDIKRDGNRLFAVPDAPDEPNVVDIIDRPGGFDRSDFLGNKLYLHTAPCYVEATAQDKPEDFLTKELPLKLWQLSDRF